MKQNQAQPNQMKLNQTTLTKSNESKPNKIILDQTKLKFLTNQFKIKGFKSNSSFSLTSISITGKVIRCCATPVQTYSCLVIVWNKFWVFFLSLLISTFYHVWFVCILYLLVYLHWHFLEIAQIFQLRYLLLETKWEMSKCQLIQKQRSIKGLKMF